MGLRCSENQKNQAVIGQAQAKENVQYSAIVALIVVDSLLGVLCTEPNAKRKLPEFGVRPIGKYKLVLSRSRYLMYLAA